MSNHRVSQVLLEVLGTENGIGRHRVSQVLLEVLGTENGIGRHRVSQVLLEVLGTEADASVVVTTANPRRQTIVIS